MEVGFTDMQQHLINSYQPPQQLALPVNNWIGLTSDDIHGSLNLWGLDAENTCTRRVRAARWGSSSLASSIQSGLSTYPQRPFSRNFPSFTHIALSQCCQFRATHEAPRDQARHGLKFLQCVLRHIR